MFAKHFSEILSERAAKTAPGGHKTRLHGLEPVAACSIFVNVTVRRIGRDCRCVKDDLELLTKVVSEQRGHANAAWGHLAYSRANTDGTGA